jgi:catechol 2,3-dioxygenase-like lactoylglutathione lyase family enzyme
MWEVKRIDHVVVWCRDLEKSMAFYKALGCEIDQGTLERYLHGTLPFVKVITGPDSGIDLRPNAEWRPVDRAKGNMQHMNLAIDGVEDIQVVIDILAERGLKPGFGPEVQGGKWGFDIYDPDNNRIEIRLSVPAESS